MKYFLLLISFLLFAPIYAANDISIELKYGTGYFPLSNFNNNFKDSIMQEAHWCHIIMPKFAFVFNNFDIGLAYSYSETRVVDVHFSETFGLNQKCIILDYKQKIFKKIIYLNIGGNLIFGETNYGQVIDNSIVGGYSAFTFGFAPYFGLDKIFFKHFNLVHYFINTLTYYELA